jgi:hypothetical protein
LPTGVAVIGRKVEIICGHFQILVNTTAMFKTKVIIAVTTLISLISRKYVLISGYF